jgi:hypothetical protein
MPTIGSYNEDFLEPTTATKYTFKSSITVDKHGVFRIEIRDSELWKVMNVLLPENKEIVAERGKKYWGILSDNLVLLKKFIALCVHNMLTPQTHEELVVLYANGSHWIVWEDSENHNIWGSGLPSDAPPSPRGHWIGQNNSLNPTFSHAVGANVYIKSTYSFGTKTNVTYTPALHDDSNLGPYGQLLASFTMLRPNLHKDCIELPYAENTAQFFYEHIMKIVQLNIYMEKMLSKDRILETLNWFDEGHLILPEVSYNG